MAGTHHLAMAVQAFRVETMEQERDQVAGEQ